MYFAGHILKPSERESSEGDSSGDAVAKIGRKVLRSDSPTFKLPAGSRPKPKAQAQEAQGQALNKIASFELLLYSCRRCGY